MPRLKLLTRPLVRAGEVVAFPVVALSALAFLSASRRETDLQERISSAKPLAVEDVVAPVRGTQGGRVTLVPNPDGRSYDVLIHYFNTYWGPHTIVVLDLGAGTVQEHTFNHALFQGSVLGPDGKLYGNMTGKKGTAIYFYDSAENRLGVLPGEARIGGEARPMVVGTDGRIYGAGTIGTRAAAYQLDTATETVTDYGPLGPSHAPDRAFGYSVAADDTHVYLASGKVPWYLLAYERRTHKTSVLLTMREPRSYVGVRQDRYGVEALVRVPNGGDKNYWLYHGHLLPKDKRTTPPWRVPPKPEPWVKLPPKPDLGLGEKQPSASGQAAVWYRDQLPRALGFENPSPGTTAAELGWRELRYEVPTYPAAVTHLLALPDGRLFGVASHYFGSFLYDPETNQATDLGRLPLSPYCTISLDGRAYLGGYPNGSLFVYDPASRWTALKTDDPRLKPLPVDSPAANPRRLAYLGNEGSGIHIAWAAVRGADGRIYFGGRWYRNGSGGGVGWWDPQTRTAGGFYEPFKAQQVTFMTSAAGGRFIVISTRAVRDSLDGRRKPRSGHLFIFDTTQGKIVNDFVPVADAEFAGAVASGPGTTILGLTCEPSDTGRQNSGDVGSVLYSMDVTTGRIVFRRRLPYPVGFLTNGNFDHEDGFSFAAGPDGKIWTYTGGKMAAVNPGVAWGLAYVDAALVRIDPTDGQIDVVGKVDRTGEIAFIGHDLYLSGGSKYYPAEETQFLRRIRDVVP